MLYELVRGVPPFSVEEPWATYQKILKHEFTFGPKESSKGKSKTKKKKEPTESKEQNDDVENAYGFTKQSRDLIRKLLTVDSSKRLGSTSGFIEIKTHPWFSSVDWDLARERKWRKPQIIPNCPKPEKEMYEMLQKTAEQEGFDEESSARHGAIIDFVFSAEDEKKFQELDSSMGNNGEAQKNDHNEGDDDEKTITMET